MSPPWVALGELAVAVGGRVRGDASLQIAGIRALADAHGDHLSPLFQPRYKVQATQSGAGALLVAATWEADAELAERNLLVVPQPPLALVRLLHLFHPEDRPAPGIHPTAVVSATARVASSASVGPFAVVGEQTSIGEGVVLEAHVVVGKNCAVGARSRLHPHVVLYDGVELGTGVRVHAGAVLGADGFGYATHGGVHHKVPQVGRVMVEDEVEIGANSAVDRATLGVTRLGAGSKVDNLVQVGHNVEIGKACIVCGQAGIAGSTLLGDGVVLGGQAGVSGHLSVGSGVQVAAKSALLQSAERGQFGGIPAVPLSAWRRQVAALPRLGEMLRRLKAVERQMGIQSTAPGEGGEDERGESRGKVRGG